MALQKKAEAQVEARFEDWSNKTADYIRVFLTVEKDASADEAEQLTFAFVRMLNEILEYAINQNRFKESWEPTMFMPYVDGLHILKKAKRTQTDFEFGIDLRGFYFQLSPRYISNLRYMDDTFWKEFLQLSETGEFDFVVSESLGRVETVKDERKIKDGKSKLFTLLKNYLLYEFYEGEAHPFGHIMINWPFPYNWDDLLLNLTNAVRICYNLDYLLWKPAYQKSMAKKQQIGKGQRQART